MNVDVQLNTGNGLEVTTNLSIQGVCTNKSDVILLG